MKSRLALLLLLCTVSNCMALDERRVRAERPSRVQGASAAIDRLLDEHVRNGDFSGTVFVEQTGGAVLKKAYGLANLELHVANKVETKFRIGSITKQFTAAAVLLLVEQGRLSLKAHVCDFVEDCSPAWSAITVHHALIHTSGVPELLSLEEFKKALALPSNPASTISRLMKYPLAFTPGEKFNYSNSDYVMLTLIIETVSGESYSTFIHDNILAKLGMESSGVDDARALLPNRASGYMKREGKVINAEYIDMSLPAGAGGMYSTIEDMHLWKQVFTPGRLLSKQFLDAMFKPYVKADWGDGVGYGWFIGRDKHGHEFFAHLGGINGFAANVRYYPTEDLYVVVLSNFSFSPIDDVTNEIVSAMFRD